MTGVEQVGGHRQSSTMVNTVSLGRVTKPYFNRVRRARSPWEHLLAILESNQDPALMEERDGMFSCAAAVT
jgi:hypothetical protein